MLFALIWVVGVLGALLLLWWGIYRLRPVEMQPQVCVVNDAMVLLIGALGLALVAAIGWLIMGSGAWCTMVAAPGFVTTALVLAFPCSFLPQLVLPFLSMVAVGSIVPIVWLYFAGIGGPASGSADVGGE
ncbi:hypothetical protein MK786_03815 [Microbacterium sp. CFH 31415]|uniref:hypothetical protein n=1 Tax=Microbacterium sp. CFH 31415 TaxID=2921732 RepID=UPI001F134069|nr:hypothetical protein [Microbacterium sp. CFH 31415]MCH6229861.1 hypothetical protein [Microbacterium sp. CFH 31415]